MDLQLDEARRGEQLHDAGGGPPSEERKRLANGRVVRVLARVAQFPSMSTTQPPGRSSRHHSASATSGHGNVQSTCRSMTTWKRWSGAATASASPTAKVARGPRRAPSAARAPPSRCNVNPLDGVSRLGQQQREEPGPRAGVQHVQTAARWRDLAQKSLPRRTLLVAVDGSG